MELNYLREFVIFSKHLKLSAAAREAFVSTSTLSQHLQALESELGYRLIAREAKETHLTEKGIRALEIVQIILNNYDVLTSLGTTSDGARFTIRIPNYVFGKRIFNQAKDCYERKHPGSTVRIETNELQKGDPFGILEAGACDFSGFFLIREDGNPVEEAIPPNLQSIGVASGSILVIERADIESTSENISLDELQGSTFVQPCFPLASMFANQVDGFLQTRDIRASFLFRMVNRPEDVIDTLEAGERLLWFSSLGPSSELDPRYTIRIPDFPWTYEAYVLYDPEKLTAAQLGYAECLKKVTDTETS